MKEQFESFYNERLKQFGHSAKGVGWKNEEAQKMRFTQLAKIITHSGTDFCLNDLGCGIGDFASYLKENNFNFTYTGYDVLTEMILEASRRFVNFPNTKFKLIKTASEMEVADYTIASGIFNIRFNCDDEGWLEYILETIRTINSKSTFGFAFNVLTKYSDREFMKEELYYADPLFMFDYCKKNFSKNVALLHDYDQYDFTILVRKS
jgi:SAM-dependent methyltransferase